MSKKKTKVGIVGVGMVGGTMRRWYEEEKKKYVDLYLYDKGKKIGSMQEVNRADIIFVCVPTPYSRGKGYDLLAILETLGRIMPKKIVVIRSTILPGTCERLQKIYPYLKILFNPEFLSEQTAYENFTHPVLQVVGFVNDDDLTLAMDVLQLLPKASYRSVACKAKVAESVKMVRNLLSASTVVVLNEAYDILKKAGVDYETIALENLFSVKRGLADLATIPSYHLTVVHKGGRGAGGKCLAKELYAFCDFGKIVGRDSPLINMISNTNYQLLKKYPKKK